MNTRSPIEELEKGQKELKGFAVPLEEQQYKPTSTPKSPKDETTNQRVHLEEPKNPVAYVTEDGLVVYQSDERRMVL